MAGAVRVVRSYVRVDAVRVVVHADVIGAVHADIGAVHADIGAVIRQSSCQRIYLHGCRQEKEERQAEENRLRMKQEEREDATLSRETQGQQEALAENKGE